MTELEALTNATTGTCLKVYEWIQHDKRKTVKKYFVQMDKATISPKLDYEQMNLFLLGFKKGILLTTKQTHK